MKTQKKEKVIFLIFLSLISMSILNFTFLNNKSNNDIEIQNIDENLNGELKLSLTQEWNTSWDDGNDEYGYAVMVEESTGNLYVTGKSDDSVDNDVILVKYNSNGQHLWNVTWDSGRNDYINDVELDSNGNVYLVGACGDSYGDMDVILIKFNSSGGYQWNKTHDRGGLHDTATALDIDNNDLIYVVGATYNSDKALILLQYNNTGHLQWESIFDGVEDQQGDALILDSMNNIYVAGYNGSTTASNDLFVVKFNSSGHHIWNQTWGQYGYADQAFGITLDSKNSIYITGHTKSYGVNDYDFVIVKYDNNGNWQWNHTWGYNSWDEAKGIAVDSEDFIYICGSSVFSNVSLLKYSASGDLIWEKTWANNSAYKYWWEDVIIDSSDYIYIVGYNRTGISAPYDLFTAKFFIEYPGEFTLTADCGSIDTDGAFMLNWTASLRVNNYSIYQYSSYITEINNTLTSLIIETNNLSLPLTGYANGTFYFIGAAFNDFGNKTSNCISVNVQITPQDIVNQPNIIPGYNLLLFGMIISFVSVILTKKRLKPK